MLREERESLIGFGFAVFAACLAVVVLGVAFGTKKDAPREETAAPVVSAYGISTVKVDGHDYLRFHWRNAGGICHSASCPCQTNRIGKAQEPSTN